MVFWFIEWQGILKFSRILLPYAGEEETGVLRDFLCKEAKGADPARLLLC